MRYRVYYKCQNCGVKFFFNYDRDELVLNTTPFVTETSKNLFEDKEFLNLLFKRNRVHSCEVHFIGIGKPVALRKLVEDTGCK